MVAAAVLGAGAITAGGSIWGANTAANTQQNIANQEIANTNNIYGQNKSLMQPFINAGQNALTPLTNLVTGQGPQGNILTTLQSLLTPGADQSATLSQTPGYSFAQGQGNRQILNALAARGLGGAPGAITQDIGSFSSGLANQTYGTTVSNLLALLQTNGNQLQSLVNTGVNAGDSVTKAGTAATTSINSALTGSGNAQAAAANATGSAIGGLGNSAGTAAIIQQFTGGGNNSSIYGNTGPGSLFMGGGSPTGYGVG